MMKQHYFTFIIYCFLLCTFICSLICTLISLLLINAPPHTHNLFTLALMGRFLNIIGNPEAEDNWDTYEEQFHAYLGERSNDIHNYY